MINSPPTERQQEVLDFINSHMDEHGVPPTISEMGLQLGVTSKQGVMCHIVALCRKGLIINAMPGKSRNWRPVHRRVCTTECPDCKCEFEVYEDLTT